MLSLYFVGQNTQYNASVSLGKSLTLPTAYKLHVLKLLYSTLFLTYWRIHIERVNVTLGN